MLNFDLHIPTRILFGRDTHKEIGTLLQPHAVKALPFAEKRGWI